MEAACFSEISVSTYKAVSCHSLDGNNLNNHGYEDLKI
jgi:hypothetical protein